MSATLDNDRLRRLMRLIIIFAGRSFPVTHRYAALNRQQRFEEAVAREETGSLLLFLPGVAEIERVRRELEAHVSEGCCS